MEDTGVDDLLNRGVRVVDVDIDRRSVQLVILGDGADVLLVDLILVRGVTTVANEDGAGQFLIEHDAHLALEPSDHVKVGDVDQIVTVELLLLVDGRRGGDPLGETEELFTLHVSGDVTLCSGLILGDVCVKGLDPAEGALVRLAEQVVDPLHATREELRSVLGRNCVREEEVNTLNAVREHVTLDGLLEGAVLSCFGEHPHHVAMSQAHRGGLSGFAVLLEDVAARHVITFLGV